MQLPFVHLNATRWEIQTRVDTQSKHLFGEVDLCNLLHSNVWRQIAYFSAG